MSESGELVAQVLDGMTSSEPETEGVSWITALCTADDSATATSPLVSATTARLTLATARDCVPVVLVAPGLLRRIRPVAALVIRNLLWSVRAILLTIAGFPGQATDITELMSATTANGCQW